MLYRKFGNTNKEISILGFGCMRLPVLNQDTSQINEVEAIAMIRHAIDQGVNYVDTAYPYHGKMSEPFVGRALQNGYREKVYLATKLPSWLIQTREDMDNYLNEQLERLQTDHIDFYLVHALDRNRWSHLKQLGIGEFLDNAIANGRIKYAGFSFHDNVDVFKEIVDSWHWTFCQIQYNYVDETFQAGRQGLDYAVSHGLGVIIMEPLRGGRLAEGIPTDVQTIWDQADVKRSPAEWALRFLWDDPGIGIVLSGMSKMEQVEENLSIASQGQALSLTAKEKSLIQTVKKLYQKKIKVNCTSCEYCMPCPAGVDIPTCFTSFNNAHMFNNITAAKVGYGFMGPTEKASNCVDCGKCEEVCPQNIPIRTVLKKVTDTFEN